MRPELFTYFETVFPLQKNKDLIGTPAWEYKLGFGLTRGKPSGTYTFRLGIEWDGEDKKFDAGEYALEYLRRFSSKWRYFSMIEGNQLDEVDFVNEIRWHFHPRAYLISVRRSGSCSDKIKAGTQITRKQSQINADTERCYQKQNLRPSALVSASICDRALGTGEPIRG